MTETKGPVTWSEYGLELAFAHVAIMKYLSLKILPSPYYSDKKINENSIIHKIVIDYNMGNILIKASNKFQIVFQLTLRLIYLCLQCISW